MKQTSLVDEDLLEGEDTFEEFDAFEGDGFSEREELGVTDALDDVEALDEFEEADALGDEFEEELLAQDEGDALDEFGDFAFDSANGLHVPRRPVVGMRSQAATLAGLRSFTRSYIRAMVRRRQRIDCADLAIEVWITFGERHRVPVSFRVWEARGRRWLTASRPGVRAGRAITRRFASYPAFIRWVQGNLGARNLIGNTFAVPGGHRSAVAGDVFLWQYRNNRTRALARVGHTQILDRVVRGSGGPSTDTIQIYQGNLPPVVPQLRRLPASYFYRNRTATIGGAPHTGIPVGPGPRRFKAFRSLR